MSKPVIEVDKLTKRYRLGAVGQTTLRDTVDHFWRTRIRRQPGFRKHAATEYLALKEVSFDLARGEVLGVIGRNGAGKSTLLKILSRITEPSSGEVRLRGRVSSLLEVGTGFHPDLSGRENIYLNGSILGMKRPEIARRFDEIVEFSEVGEFLDTPVKHYSSGMYVRLAFAVAAHLEPDVLIVDEVLAVGDQKFQDKCIGKMHDIARSRERTVLFVSHNLANIRQLCTSAILLNRGALAIQGDTETVLRDYAKSTNDATPRITADDDQIRLCSIRLADAATDETTDHPVFNRDYFLEMVLEAREPLRDAMIVAEVADETGVVVSTLGTVEEGANPFVLRGLVTVSFRLEALGLTPGLFRVRASVFRWLENDPRLQIENALTFEVQPATIDSALAPYLRTYGFVRIARGVKIEQHALAPS